MKVIAGVDVGNSTTEVVLVEIGSDADADRATLAERPMNSDADTVGGAEPRCWDRVVTRGVKGSPSSLDGAAALVRRLMRTSGLSVDHAVVARLRPVRTGVDAVTRAHASTGRLWPVRERSGTPGGAGVGVGRPVLLDSVGAGTAGPVVVLVPSGVGYAQAASGLRDLMADGVAVVGVVLVADEAVLVANRLPRAVPVIDNVDGAELTGLAAARLVALEVAAPGGGLRQLNDPIYLSSIFGLDRGELPDATGAAGQFDGRRRALVALRDACTMPAVASSGPEDPGPVSVSVEFGDGARLELAEADERLRTTAPGGVRALWRPPDWRPVDDVFALDLHQLARGVAIDLEQDRRPFAVSSLDRLAAVDTAADELADRLGFRVVAAGSEALAARRGALSTPGAPADALVVDLGGGTLDLIGADGTAITAAGAGELITTSVAALLGIVRGAAEWVKRGPCARVDAPQVLVGEDGQRTFLDAPAAADAVGRLVVPGPGGLLPFSGRLSASEWRLLRRSVKREVLGVNLARCLEPLAGEVRSVVVVGGPAGDDELIASMAGVLGAGIAVGRGNVAGVLGHRYAVAFGLAQNASVRP